MTRVLAKCQFSAPSIGDKVVVGGHWKMTSKRVGSVLRSFGATDWEMHLDGVSNDFLMGDCKIYGERLDPPIKAWGGEQEAQVAFVPLHERLAAFALGKQFETEEETWHRRRCAERPKEEQDVREQVAEAHEAGAAAAAGAQEATSCAVQRQQGPDAQKHLQEVVARRIAQAEANAKDLLKAMAEARDAERRATAQAAQEEQARRAEEQRTIEALRAQEEAHRAMEEAKGGLPKAAAAQAQREAEDQRQELVWRRLPGLLDDMARREAQQQESLAEKSKIEIQAQADAKKKRQETRCDRGLSSCHVCCGGPVSSCIASRPQPSRIAPWPFSSSVSPSLVLARCFVSLR